MAFRGKGQKMPDICDDTLSNSWSWSPCFLLAGRFPRELFVSMQPMKTSRDTVVMYPEGSRYYLGISLRVSTIFLKYLYFILPKPEKQVNSSSGVAKKVL
jgi:hypothetical protein